MYRYKKILVAMDLEKDASAVKFAARISHMAESEEIHFFHVTDEHDLPENLCSAIEGAGDSCDTIIDKMKKTVGEHWDGFASARLEYNASDGDMLKDILFSIKENDIDLVVVEKVCGDSKTPERLARKATCSVLLIPPGSKPDLKNIFVALDFSKHSEEALEKALVYAKASGTKKITCVHVYSVPLGYQKTGHTHEEFAEILKNNAHKNFEKTLRKLDLEDTKIDFIVEMNKYPYQGIVDIVHENNVDLLVVGARGRSKTGAILLGSVTERLVDVCNVPILAVKKKGQGMSLLEAMFGI